MEYTVHKITLDIHKTVSAVSVRVKKGDTGRRLLIHLVEKGFPYHISKECYAVFTAKKPDGNVVFNNCRIEDCVIAYDFTEQTVAVAGLVECEIILYGSGGKQLTSASFNIIVEDTIYDTETEVESTSEYNALADLVAKVQAIHANGPLAPAVVREAEGEQISLTDASNQALQSLRIFGKSTQGGTPTPEMPVEIVNVGFGGSIEAKVLGEVATGYQSMVISTPDGLAGIPVASGGNYTDSDGQEWICDEVDLGRGVYVQRIARIDLSTLSAWTRGTGNGWANASAFYASNAIPSAVSVEDYHTKANLLCNRLLVDTAGNIAGRSVNRVGQALNASVYVSIDGIETAEELMAYLDENKTIVQYMLATAIETKLTEEEIAAFAALRTYKPSTTVYNDVGAYMAAEYVADTKTYIDRRSGGVSGGVVTILADAWVGDESPYSQVVKIEGVTEYSQVDLKPSVEQLAIFHEKDLAFVTENEDGVVTVYAIGDKPTNDYTMQVSILEVQV